jgi:CBS domain-containing protein
MSDPSADTPNPPTPMAHTLLTLRARTARELMTPSPTCVFETDPLETAAELLARYSAVPVVDLDRHCIGVFSRTDLARALGLKRSVQVSSLALESRDGNVASDAGLEYKPPARRVGEVMTPHVYTVGLEALAGDVVRTLSDRRIGRVFVVDAEMHLVGVISTSDVIARLVPAN